MKPARATAWVLTVGGFLGLLAALALTIERIELLQDASYVPSCSLNPVLSCGTVMTTEQAALFGFPNPIIGIVAFTVVLVTGVLTLARIALPRMDGYVIVWRRLRVRSTRATQALLGGDCERPMATQFMWCGQASAKLTCVNVKHRAHGHSADVETRPKGKRDGV